MTKNKVDFRTLWLGHEKLTGRKPSTRDIESRYIYVGLRRGVAEGRAGYAEFYEQNRFKGVDWLTLWVEYEKRTGKRPSPADAESADIYKGVYFGAKRGKAGYVEVFDARRYIDQDWIQLWKDYEASTGERPSQYSEASKKIYSNVYGGARAGREGYKEFFESKRIHEREPRNAGKV